MGRQAPLPFALPLDGDRSRPPQLCASTSTASSLRSNTDACPFSRSQFVVNGPNSSLGSGSLLVLFEKEIDYIVEALDKMLRENVLSMAVKQEAVDGAFPSFPAASCRAALRLTQPHSLADWMEYTHEYFKKTVFSTKCRSWYKKGLEGAHAPPRPPAPHSLSTLTGYTSLARRGPCMRALAWLGGPCARRHLAPEVGGLHVRGLEPQPLRLGRRRLEP